MVSNERWPTSSWTFSDRPGPKLIPELSPGSGPSVMRRRRRRGTPAKLDDRTKQEKSRQSARECRARKKLRYQYLEELVTSQEDVVNKLREELQQIRHECEELDAKATPSKHQQQQVKDPASHMKENR